MELITKYLKRRHKAERLATIHMHASSAFKIYRFDLINWAFWTYTGGCLLLLFVANFAASLNFGNTSCFRIHQDFKSCYEITKSFSFLAHTCLWHLDNDAECFTMNRLSCDNVKIQLSCFKLLWLPFGMSNFAPCSINTCLQSLKSSALRSLRFSRQVFLAIAFYIVDQSHWSHPIVSDRSHASYWQPRFSYKQRQINEIPFMF